MTDKTISFALAPDIKVKGELGTNDLIAVTVTKIETSLTARLDFTRKRRADIKKTIEEIEAKRKADSTAYINSKIQPKINKVLKALASLGCKNIRTDVTFDMITDPKDPTKSIFMTTVSFGDENRVSGNRNYIQGFFGIEISMLQAKSKIPYPASLQALDVKQAELEKEYHTLGDEGTEIQSKLANINRMERQARAVLTSTMLQGSAQGEAILAKLEGIDKIDDIKALLPSPK